MTSGPAGGDDLRISIPSAIARASRMSWRAATGPSGAVLLSTVGANALRMVSTVFLTRLLDPSAFGQVAIISSTFFILTMITDLGFQAYVVRHPRGDDPAFINSVWTIHALRGFILFGIAALLSRPVAALLGKPEVEPLLLVASITIAIDGLTSFRVFTAIRNGRIPRLSAFELGLGALQVFLNIATAFFIRSAWSFVIVMVAMSCIRTALSYIVFGRHIHRVNLNTETSRDMWKFSRPIMISSFITLVLAQTDRLVLAKIFSLNEFGMYGIAFSLASAPLALAYSYANRVLYANYTSAERVLSSSAKTIYYKRSIVFFAYIFGSGSLIGAAPLIIRFLYDPRYYGAAEFLSILTISTGFVMITQAAANLFVTLGHSSYVLQLNLARAAWLVIAAPVGLLGFGPVGLIVAVGLIELPAYIYVLYKLKYLGVLAWRFEALSLLTGIGGVAVGTLLNRLTLHILPHL